MESLRLHESDEIGKAADLGVKGQQYLRSNKDGIYKFFGVPKTASPSQLRVAYIKAVRKYHPDFNPSSDARDMYQMAVLFKRILDNPQYKKAYDESGLSGLLGFTDAVKSGASVHFPQMSRSFTRDPFDFGFAVDPFVESADTFKFDPNSTKKEGRYRLQDPRLFSGLYKSIKSTTPGIRYLLGQKKGTGTWEVQAIRFNTSIMPQPKAAAWWESNKHRFKKEWEWKLP